MQRYQREDLPAVVVMPQRLEPLEPAVTQTGTEGVEEAVTTEVEQGAAVVVGLVTSSLLRPT